MVAALLAALSWEPQIKGALYVVIAVVVLAGSAFLILSTNMGARVGFQVSAAGLFGFLVTIGLLWWVYGIGPVGPSPSWMVEETIVGSPSAARVDALVGFPDIWDRLEVSDPEVADAQPAAESTLIISPGEEGGVFSSSSAYVVVGAYHRGGETYGPLGLDFRPFNLFHKASYLVIQAQAVEEVEPVPGTPTPPPVADADAPLVTVLLLRDLGSERLNPAVFTLSSALIFGLLVYQLHVRDKDALARKEELKALEKEKVDSKA